MGFRYWLVLHPDLKKPIGGVKQMHRLAESLLKINRDAYIVQDDASFHPSWFRSEVKTIDLKSWQQLELNPDIDRVILPETFLTVLQSYAPSIPKIIFNQNSSYTFGLLNSQSPISPSRVAKVYNSDIVSSVFCVSSYDRNFLINGLGLPAAKVHLIVNAIETEMFKPSKIKKKQIIYMPRKNKNDSIIVTQLLLNRGLPKGWTIKSLDACSHEEVARHMSESLVFLSFGHPEGFGLPVAEAIASGCAVIGYSGLGGRELFFYDSGTSCYTEVGYGDWVGFIESVFSFIENIETNPSVVMKSLLRGVQKVKSSYNIDKMNDSVFSAIESLEA